MVKIGRIDRLNVGWHFFAIDPSAGHRRYADDFDGLQGLLR
jgi:hypothetical protein